MKCLYAILLCLGLPGLLTAQEGPGTITTIAGVGLIGGLEISVTGVPATQIRLGRVRGIAVDSRGYIYINSGVSVARIRPDGIITPFVGSSLALSDTSVGDGRLATMVFLRIGSIFETSLSEILPAGVTADAKGNVYVTDTGDQRIRLVDSTGFIWTFAGSGGRANFFTNVMGAFSGDGEPASRARLNLPTDVALDAQGNVYIADFGNGRIRRVDTDAFISTFAGKGGGIFSPTEDGGPAAQAVLTSPVSVAVDHKGNVYIADYDAHRIRRVSPDRLITTFAGTGTEGFSGDGGPAAQARLSFPSGVAADAAGNVYIADRGNSRIRWVRPDGIIATLAGTGTHGFSGDGGLAKQAQLDAPSDVAVDDKGYVYILDFGNSRIRRVIPLKPLEIPSISLSVPYLLFETTGVGAASELTFTISNTGKALLSVTRIGAEGKDALQFKVSPTSATVDTGASLTVTVRFTPTSGGLKSASLWIEHNAAESPSIITLTGRGPEKSRDFDGNGRVDFDDFFLFATAFGQPITGSTERYDLDFNGKIDFDDFFLFAEGFGR